MKNLKTQVAIIGGGPAGMLLSHFLDLHGIRSIVVERRSKSYVLKRIRAGILETGTIDFLKDLGLTERLDREAFIQDYAHFGFEGKETLALDLKKYTGKVLIAYGQTALTEDLYAAHAAANRLYFDEVENVKPSNLDSANPLVDFTKNGEDYRIECDFVAGCDGFYGVSRQCIPTSVKREFEIVYPFGWLGIMAKVPPLDELLYAWHTDGFVLASKRNPMLSRYYVQCPLTDKLEDWSDDRFWEAVLKRLPAEYQKKVVTGPSIEKSIAPLRSFVSEPMSHGKLFLAGDAAHIVPPTGAKGLNLAVSDVYYLGHALNRFYKNKDESGLKDFSRKALLRVWSSVNLSWKLTRLLHTSPNETPFDAKIRSNDFDLLTQYEPMRQSLAFENVGLPF